MVECWCLRASASTGILALALIVLAVALAFHQDTSAGLRIVTVPVDTSPRYVKYHPLSSLIRGASFSPWLVARRNVRYRSQMIRVCSTVLVFCIAILTVAIIGAIGADVRIGRIARS